jgi:predicted ATPase/predicted negative regulator of RcsB-dependent stress response
VTAFTDLTGLQDLSGLEKAVALYRGHFLEGFSLKDSPLFEDWALLTRERLQRQALAAFHRLAGYNEGRGEYERACEFAWRQVELEPWLEEAHRQLMRLLALSGQRSAALAQYETCRRALAEEVGVEPAKETTRLYEQIRDGEVQAPLSFSVRAAKPPLFLVEEEPVEVERPVFVAREHELAQLDRFLGLALGGQGRVVFVTGEAGSGKTALVQEFARRAQEAAGQALVVASGNCNAHTGVGDPYLPFREILGLLTGDVEARWFSGAISREHARRLWNTIPLVVEALVEAGPDLIGTFVPSAALVGRAATFQPSSAEWLARLDELVERKATVPGAPGPQQSDLFEQYTRVLQALRRHAPLVLVVDDLQWVDAGSVSLLFHLGRRLAGSRILIIGAYRPEEVALRRNGERHPLDAVVNEFQRGFGSTVVDVDRAESRDFVEALLDSEPNRLGPPFREVLYRQTRGHPLFTIELLLGMQERGDLVQDQEGRWIEGPALDWQTLPVRVEAVIAERIGRLAQPLQATLRVASVEGETFTAEVVARVQAADAREMAEHLSHELDRKHRLVHAQGILRLDGQRLSHYQFRHILFQRYLYSSLDRVERGHLHEEVGNALEALYGEGGEGTAAIALQLARHFQEAKIVGKAVGYLRQAGDRAVRLSAHEEAGAHLSRALALLETLPDTPERAQQELALLLALGMTLQAVRGYSAPEVGRAYDRAYELCRQLGKTPQIFPLLGLLCTYYTTRGDYHTACEIVGQLLRLAEQAEDPLLIAVAHWLYSVPLYMLGELAQAQAHLEHVIAFYDPQQHHTLAFVYGLDPGVVSLSVMSWMLWALGYPEQALKRNREAIGLAQELSHLPSLAWAQSYADALFIFCRDWQAAQSYADALIRLSAERGFEYWRATGLMGHGWALAQQGQTEEGIAQLREGIAASRAVGNEALGVFQRAILAEAYYKAGQAEEGLAVVAEALAVVQRHTERFYEAEVYRLKGELLLLQGDEAEAEASFQQAIKVARRQQAKSWELRATTSLCRLWQKQGKREEARQMLAEIYGWFTEGFDMPDLKEAKALLEESS